MTGVRRRVYHDVAAGRTCFRTRSDWCVGSLSGSALSQSRMVGASLDSCFKVPWCSFSSGIRPSRVGVPAVASILACRGHGALVGSCDLAIPRLELGSARIRLCRRPPSRFLSSHCWCADPLLRASTPKMLFPEWWLKNGRIFWHHFEHPQWVLSFLFENAPEKWARFRALFWGPNVGEHGLILHLEPRHREP